MPAIILERPSESIKYIGYIDIYINGKKVGDIEREETLYIELTAKKHTLMVKRKWLGGSKPIEINLSNKKDVAVEIKPNKYINWVPVLIPALLSYSFWKMSWHYNFYPSWIVSTFVVIGFIIIGSMLYSLMPKFKLNVKKYAVDNGRR